MQIDQPIGPGNNTHTASESKAQSTRANLNGTNNGIHPALLKYPTTTLSNITNNAWIIKIQKYESPHIQFRRDYHVHCVACCAHCTLLYSQHIFYGQKNIIKTVIDCLKNQKEKNQNILPYRTVDRGIWTPQSPRSLMF